MNDAIKGGVDAYIVKFSNYKKKVVETFSVLDLSKILAPEKEKMEEGEVAEQEVVETNEVAIEVLKIEVTVAGDPKKAIAIAKT